MYSYKLNDSYYVEFDTLNRKLKEISHGTHQWMAAPVPRIFMTPGQQPRSCALVGYSNPDGTSLPNHLCYLFPVAALAGNSDDDPKLLVQLEPGWMPTLSRGLYCDDGKIMIDPMEDFFRVWLPLKYCLGLLDNAEIEEQYLGYEPRRNQDVSVEDETATRKALHKHLIWLTEFPELIQEAVSDDVDPMEFIDRTSRMFRRRRQKEE